MQENGKVDLIQIIQAMKDVVDLWALVYVYMSRPVITAGFGKRGEIAIREGIREFGAFRGGEMRKWHEAEGLPINVETLNRFWDAAGLWLIKDTVKTNARFTPYHVTYPVYECSIRDVWKQENWEQYGYWYCDENHESIMKGYRKDGVVEIHLNLCKGDDRCSFEWMQIPAGPVDNSATIALERKMADNPVPYSMQCLKRTVRIVGAIYIFLAKAIVEHLGDEGKALIREAVAALGQRRAKTIREKLRVSGKTTTVENIFTAFDLPYELMWDFKYARFGERFKARVDYCPLAELWQELGLRELGGLYCDGMYESMFHALALNSQAKISIPECITRGDKHCTFDFNL